MTFRRLSSKSGIAVAFFLLLFLWSSTQLWSKHQQTHAFAQSQALQLHESYNNLFHQTFTRLLDRIAQLAQQPRLTNQSDESVVQRHLLHEAKVTAGLFAFGLLYREYQINRERRSYAPFIRYNETDYTLDRLDQYYDYLPLIQTESKPQWLPWQYDKAHETEVIRYLHPTAISSTQTNYLFLDFDRAWFKRLLANIDRPDNSELFLLNQSGTVLYQNTLSPTIPLNDLPLSQLAETQASTTPVVLKRNNHWVSLSSLTPSPLVLAIVTPNEYLLSHAIESNKTLPLTKWHNGNWVLITAFFLLSLLHYAFVHAPFKWRLSPLPFAVLSSTVLLLSTTILWVIHFQNNFLLPQQHPLLTHEASINHFQQQYALQRLQQGEIPPIYIPVGIFIQSLEFQNSTNVSLTGYVWLSYPKTQSLTDPPKLIFKDSIMLSLTQVEHIESSSHITVEWRFNTTLRQPFSYKNYPFDQQLVWLRIGADAPTSPYVFIPDTHSYQSLIPKDTPGLESPFVIPNWHLNNAFFDVKWQHYDVSLGHHKQFYNSVPELFFNIQIQRNPLTPMISYLFPLLIIFIMLYASLLTFTRSDRKRNLSGYNTQAIIASCSALFFVAVLSHSQLRTQVPSSHILYMEHFFFLCYFMLLLTMLNALFLNTKISFFQRLFRRENLIIKVMFWPFISATTLLMTYYQLFFNIH